MLTVKQVAPGGHETIRETRTVSAEPAPTDPSDAQMGLIGRVFWEREDGGMSFFETGTIYVMNEAGKTVSVYHLAGWAEPVTEAT